MGVSIYISYVTTTVFAFVTVPESITCMSDRFFNFVTGQSVLFTSKKPGKNRALLSNSKIKYKVIQ